MGHHDEDAKTPHPANRLGLDYRRVPPRKLPGLPIIDAHTHIRRTATIAEFFAAAELYGVQRFVTMSPLEDVDALREAYPDRLAFIAVPRWREFRKTEEFRARWLADLQAFRALGARLMKFWMAPPMRGDHQLTLADPFLEPVIETALGLGFDFMVHIADPSAWWAPGRKYADAARFGTKYDQYPQLEVFLERVSPRFVIAAHMGGSIEELDFLQNLLDLQPNLYIDSSATKWIVRGIAPQPGRAREFLMRNADRILFGTDLVVDDKYDFDHYASRFWVHQMLWETAYRGESPIEDPDAEGPPQLAGLDLPAEALRKMYTENAAKLGVGF